MLDYICYFTYLHSVDLAVRSKQTVEFFSFANLLVFYPVKTTMRVRHVCREHGKAAIEIQDRHMIAQKYKNFRLHQVLNSNQVSSEGRLLAFSVVF